MQSILPTWLRTRSAGVLAHVSSLPGDYGIGNLGLGARHFVDFLALAGFRNWQVCPIGPTGFGDSPYQLLSSQAGNPYFIDLTVVKADGLLETCEVDSLRDVRGRRVDYGRLYDRFWPVLARAYDRFAKSGADGVNDLGSFREFRRANSNWVEGFADFMALKSRFGGRPWTLWPQQYLRWDPALRALLPPSTQLDADRHVFYQYIFHGQWRKLRCYAADRGVSIIGDLPMFVAHDSADTWLNRSVFRLDAAGRPTVIGGAPPDEFSPGGQLWGTPIYDWRYLERTGYVWWIDRLRSALALYDSLRLDHFRGFESYLEIPVDSTSVFEGRMHKGPGMRFLEAVRRELPGARLIAEDLGSFGPEAAELRRAGGIPGIKILQFSFGRNADAENLPDCFPNDSVAYTGTHDTNTTRGWLEGLSGADISRVRAYIRHGDGYSAWPLIRALLAANSRLAIVPMQDLFDLPSWAALNRPGTLEGNWQWRFTLAQLQRLSRDRLETLREWIHVHGRCGASSVIKVKEPVYQKGPEEGEPPQLKGSKNGDPGLRDSRDAQTEEL